MFLREEDRWGGGTMCPRGCKSHCWHYTQGRACRSSKHTGTDLFLGTLLWKSVAFGESRDHCSNLKQYLLLLSVSHPIRSRLWKSCLFGQMKDSWPHLNSQVPHNYVPACPSCNGISFHKEHPLNRNRFGCACMCQCARVSVYLRTPNLKTILLCNLN